MNAAKRHFRCLPKRSNTLLRVARLVSNAFGAVRDPSASRLGCDEIARKPVHGTC